MRRKDNLVVRKRQPAVRTGRVKQATLLLLSLAYVYPEPVLVNHRVSRACLGKPSSFISSHNLNLKVRKVREKIKRDFDENGLFFDINGSKSPFSYLSETVRLKRGCCSSPEKIVVVF